MSDEIEIVETEEENDEEREKQALLAKMKDLGYF